MPIEIRELVIRTTVTGDDEAAASPSSRASAATPDRAALVAECVEQVMEILREQKER